MDPQIDICADCSGPSPQWASVNRGVLLCDECSSIHRQLGRHISQIKHLKKSRWRPSQLEMMHSLVSTCANRYWEHVLFEPMLHAASNRLINSSFGTSADGKKPRPNDPTYPNKADFIREKYLFLVFFKKPKSVNREDLNRQLHASVRTGVLETSLYLLALGANPNFVNLDKGGTSPLHVACQHGQVGQVELLLAYGADVCLRDHRGSTPVDVALEKALSKGGDAWRPPAEPPTTSEQHPLRMAWSPLVTALVEAYYEIPDSLAYFLSRRVPDHRLASLLVGVGSGGHFLVATPFLQALRCNDSTSAGGPPDSSWAVEARRRLTQLPGPAFEDLCVDVYDEADRRITNSFLESADTLANVTNRSPGETTTPATTTNGLHSLSSPAPGPLSHKAEGMAAAAAANRGLTLFFLPPNTSYSSVRNQARQKLGRLSTVEFHTLVLDLLIEISTRLLPLLPPMSWSQTTAASATAAAAQPSGVSVIGRNVMAPLPRPPVTGDPAAEAATDNSPPAVSSISSCNSSHEALDRVGNYSGGPDLQEAKQYAAANDTGGCPKRHCDRFGGGRSRDDPVYDQVAGELEQPSPLPVGADVISRSLRTPTDEGPPGVEATPPHPTLQSPLTVDTAEVESRGLARNPSSMSPCTPTSVCEDAPGVTSSPGQLPGSRRLHLAHVSRPSDHRASVPAAVASQHSGLTLKMESAGLSMESTTAGDLAISTVGKRWTGDRPAGGQTCSGEVLDEVERLREENRRLLSRVVELESANEAGESRRLKLESRLKELDTTVGLLKEEKSALLAAFSAGMVLSHPVPRSSESPRQSSSESGFSSPDPKAKEKTTAEAHRRDRRPLPMVADLPEDTISDDEGEGEHVEDIDEEDEAGGAEYNKAGEATGSKSDDTGADGGNYSLGSECLNSGMLFRQGIVLRSGPSRVVSSASPPTSHPVSRAFPNTSSTGGAASEPVRERPGAAAMTYVNVRPPPRALLAGGGKSAAVVFTTAIKMVGCPAAETSSGGGSGGRKDTSYYAAPTSTGSVSPHPPTSSNSTTNPVLLPTTSAVESSSHRGAGAGTADAQTSVQKVKQLQQQHAQILASIASLPDYENDTGCSGGGGVSTTAAAPVHRPSVELLPASSSSSGKGMPSPERVLRCVEAIIVHIRSLVELANSKRLEEATNCSLLIYSAVKETLALFPDDRSACPPSVAQPLTELMSVSRQLVTIKVMLAMPPAASIPCSDINLLIRYAHQIAKAARQLLALFQRIA